MKSSRVSWRCTLGSTAVMLAFGAGGVGAQSSTMDNIRRLDSAWARSYAVHDTALAKAIFAEDLVVVGGNGMLKNRDGEMRDIRPAPGLKMHYFRTVGADVRCYTSSCVVIGVAEWEFEFNGRIDATRRRYSATWVRGGSQGWQMVALHISTALPAVGGGGQQ